MKTETALAPGRMPRRPVRSGWVVSCLMLALAMLACEVPPAWIASLAPGGTWYVAVGGRNSNDCLSAASACLTVGAALAKARTGGVIQVGAGTFREVASDLAATGIHMHGKVVTLRGSLTAGAPATILDGAGVRTPVVIDGGDVVILQDLVIQGGGAPAGGIGAGLKISGAAGAPAGVSLRNVVIRNNVLHGLIVSGPANVTLDNVRVTLNRLDGVVVAGAQVDVRGSSISSNGQGLLNAPGGNVSISDSSISGNRSHPGGGVDNQADMRIERSTISGNSDSSGCSGCGSGIENSGNLTVINSTIAANGGPGILSSSSLKLAYSTVAANAAAGVVFDGGSLALGMDIVENNAGQDCATTPGSSLTGASASWYYVNLSDGSCGPLITGLTTRPGPDPYLGSLADNGGPTQTMAISIASPAYNPVVDPSTGPSSADADFEPPATDQRGRTRPEPGGRPDAGAYELYPAVPLVIATPATLEPKPTASLVLLALTPTQTGTPGPQLVLLQTNANCRKGPGTRYDVLTAFEQGASLQASARNQENTWLEVNIPSGGLCWLAESALASRTGLDGLPILPTAPLPDAPQAFTDKASCIIKLKQLSVKLSWSVAANASGYRLYRNGTLLQTLAASASNYEDSSAPLGRDLTYGLEAFNANGASERVQTVVTACK